MPKRPPDGFAENIVPTHDDEHVDEIRIRVQPKRVTRKIRKADTEDSQGDQPDLSYWGRRAEVELMRKGATIYKAGFDSAEQACKALSFTLDDFQDRDAYIEKNAGAVACSQAGCSAAAVVVKALRKRFSRHEGHDMGAPGSVQLRAFCKAHEDRGSGRPDDAAANYEAFGMIGDDDSGTDPGVA